MMDDVMRCWTEMTELERPQSGGWCDRCALPSLWSQRYMHTMHAGEATTYASILTLVECDECHDRHWKEYREAATADHQRDPDT